MKITTTKHGKTLKAVMSADNQGVFFRSERIGQSMYVDQHGFGSIVNESLEQLLNETPERKGIYEGDNVNFEF